MKDTLMDLEFDEKRSPSKCSLNLKRLQQDYVFNDKMQKCKSA
jgi:hypothetical protein